MPVFLRPCHSDFVEQTLDVAEGIVEKALYVSHPKNRDDDLGRFSDMAERIGDWEGRDGEQVFRIRLSATDRGRTDGEE